ncbi:hypothetical protein [Streptomyces sp. URMC 129]|uniref:hypothetical protein n=1 Tax=Streptomyces sp. URMC 129 TaxID=3423407 RepID=UPI003F193F8D
MDNAQAQSLLPASFLRALAAEAEPGSAPVRLAAERARALPIGYERGELVEALLTGAYREEAPEWLLAVAIDNDLERQPEPYSDRWAVRLAARALSHPSATDAFQARSLRRCSTARLGMLGGKDVPERLARAVVAELASRGPHRRPMTAGRSDQPSAARVVLQQREVHPVVFTAALDHLPVLPARDGSEEEPVSVWHAKWRAAFDAWDTMWEQVAAAHPEHHRRLLDWAKGTHAEPVIRRHLLGSLPWAVEPELLREVAQKDLESFRLHVLITRLCRERADGSAEETVRERYGADLDSLTAEERELVELYLDEERLGHEQGRDAAISWIREAAEGRWRHLLFPGEAATPYGQKHDWLSSPEQLASLGRMFAVGALEALTLLTEAGRFSGSHRDVRWAHAMLVHLDEVTSTVRERVRALVGEARWSMRLGPPLANSRRTQESLTAIERLIAEPVPPARAARSAELGPPER